MGPNFARDITWERLILLIKNDRKIRFVKRSFQGRYNLLLGGNAPQNSVSNFFLENILIRRGSRRGSAVESALAILPSQRLIFIFDSYVHVL